jgi:hypothetical protein
VVITDVGYPPTILLRVQVERKQKKDFLRNITVIIMTRGVKTKGSVVLGFRRGANNQIRCTEGQCST